MIINQIIDLCFVTRRSPVKEQQTPNPEAQEPEAAPPRLVHSVLV